MAMQICNLAQTNNYNYSINNKSIKSNTCFDHNMALASLPVLSPNYYTPNFKGARDYDYPTISISAEDLEDLKEEFKHLSQKETFDKLGIDYTEDKNGRLTISHFSTPYKYNIEGTKKSPEVYPCDLELDVDKLMCNVVRIERNANFQRMEFSPFKTLRYIGGNLNCNRSKVKSLGSLEKVEGSIFARNSALENLGNLKEASVVSLISSKNLKSISNLKRVNYISLMGTQVSNVSGLEKCNNMVAVGCPIPQKQKDNIRKLTNGNCIF